MLHSRRPGDFLRLTTFPRIFLHLVVTRRSDAELFGSTPTALASDVTGLAVFFRPSSRYPECLLSLPLDIASS